MTLKATGLGPCGPDHTTTLRWQKVSLPNGLTPSPAGVPSSRPEPTPSADAHGTITVQVMDTVINLNGKKKVTCPSSVDAIISCPIT